MLEGPLLNNASKLVRMRQAVLERIVHVIARRDEYELSVVQEMCFNEQGHSEIRLCWGPEGVGNCNAPVRRVPLIYK